MLPETLDPFTDRQDNHIKGPTGMDDLAVTFDPDMSHAQSDSPWSHPASSRKQSAKIASYFSRLKYCLIRRALVPTSLLPTRETERTSMRLPV